MHRVLVRTKKKRFPSESKKLSKKVHINRKSHSYFARALYSKLGIQSAGKIGVGFTIYMDFFG